MDVRSDSDSYPDIYEAFAHYNSLYFEDALGCCILSWTNFKNNRSIGSCHFLEGGACEINLGNQLKLRPANELKNVLLHEMIHAFLYITEKKDHSYHGPSFTARAEAIYRRSEFDHMRPSCGYNITTSHSLSEEADDKYIVSKPGYKGKEPMFSNGIHDNMGNISAASSSKRKLAARPLEFCESVDNSSSDVKRVKTTDDIHDAKGNMSVASASKRKLTARKLELSELPPPTPKRPRTTWIRREEKKASQVSEEVVKEDDLYYTSDDDEDLDKDIVPLINKRTERRKIERLLKLQRSQV